MTTNHSRKKLVIPDLKTSIEHRKIFECYTRNLLNAKHRVNEKTYNFSIINNIIYNEKAHIVAKFKDYLIFDDNSEYLKR